jgi:DNA-binding PadR family transcriptional regulator
MDGQEINPTMATVLGFLLDEPASGYELDQRIRRSTGHFWSVTRSQLYRELRVMADAGLVRPTAPGPRDRQRYRITKRGTDQFSAWLARGPSAAVLRDPLLLTVFFGDHLDRDRLRRFVADARRQSETTLQELEDLRTEATSMPFPSATLRFGIAHERAVLDWLDWLLTGADSPL